MSSVIDALFASAKMKCTVCGTETSGRKMNCDCWTECSCGWSFKKGEKCRSPHHVKEE